MSALWNEGRAFTFSLLRAIYFGTFATFFLATEWGRKVYRPYVYANGIQDGGLADVIGNLGGTVAIVFFNLSVRHATRAQGRRMIGLITAGVLAYEVLQGVLARGVFDWRDMAATVIAGSIALGLFEIIHKQLPERAAARAQVTEEFL